MTPSKHFTLTIANWNRPFRVRSSESNFGRDNPRENLFSGAWKQPQRCHTVVGMTATTSLVLLAIPLIGALSTLWFLQRRWGLDSIGQAATESLSRLLPTPLRTRSSLRRRFVRALTSQRVLMPSGQVVAATALHLRIAPEDIGRLAPDEDLDALAVDAATLYARHAQRESWQLLSAPRVSIEVDPVLRSGWIPLAQINRTLHNEPDGSGVADVPVANRRLQPMGDVPPSTSTQAIEVARPSADATRMVAVSADSTVLTGLSIPTLLLASSDGASSYVVRAPHAVIGRAEQCTVRLDDMAVSRRHARLEHREGRWLLSDLGSANGTYVGTHKLQTGEERELGDGDELRFGPDSPVLVATMRN